MVKEPRPGRVKTRLGRDIGPTAAAWWFRHQVARLLRNIEDRRWEVVIAVTPDREGLGSRIWPRKFSRVPQGTGDLGDRMGRLLESSAGRPVAVIGADIPGIRRHHLAEAFRQMGPADAVIGPAPDGGFWLIGWAGRRCFPAGSFDNVRWSTENARADTLCRLGGARIALVAKLSDVDVASDLAHVEISR